jgi:hypothetical protein
MQRSLSGHPTVEISGTTLLCQMRVYYRVDELENQIKCF